MTADSDRRRVPAWAGARLGWKAGSGTFSCQSYACTNFLAETLRSTYQREGAKSAAF